MSALRQAASDYLAVRRALGSKLEGYPRLLDSLITYLEAAGAATVTTELAVAWARLPGNDAHPSYLGKRLCVVRGFARHLQAFDPATEVPPAGLLPGRKCRAVPYLYSEADIAALMTAAGSLAPALRAATYQTLVGLLTVSGAEDRRAHPTRPGRRRWRRELAGHQGLQIREEPRGAAAPEHGRCARRLRPAARRAVPPARDGELPGVPGGSAAGLQHRPADVRPPGPRRRALGTLGTLPAPLA
jgi:hypothetical protein